MRRSLRMIRCCNPPLSVIMLLLTTVTRRKLRIRERDKVRFTYVRHASRTNLEGYGRGYMKDFVQTGEG